MSTVETGHVRLSWRGSILHAFLLKASVVDAARLLRHPSKSPELVYQAFVLMARRSFAGQPERDPIEYVATVTATDRSASMERIGIAGQLLESGLVPRRPHLKMPRRHQDLVTVLLLAMVRDARMSSVDVAALVQAAERRLDRLQRKSPGRYVKLGIFEWLSSRSSTAEESRLVKVREATDAPRTVIGNILRALAGFDNERADAMPQEPDFETGLAIVDAAFKEAAVKGLSTAPERRHVVRFVEGAVRPDLSLSQAQLVDLIMCLPGSTADYQSLDREGRLQLKALVFVDMCEALGLFGGEIDGLIRRAEEAVQAAGYHPKIL